MPGEGALSPNNCEDKDSLGHRPDWQAWMVRMHPPLSGERSESLSGEARRALPGEGALSPNNCVLNPNNCVLNPNNCWTFFHSPY